MTQRHDIDHPDVPRRPFLPAVVRITMGADASDVRHQHTAYMLATVLARMTGVVHAVQLHAPVVACSATLSPFSQRTHLTDHIVEAVDAIGLPCKVNQTEEEPVLVIHIGAAKGRADLFAAGNGWTGAIATSPIHLEGHDGNVIGPYVAACLAAAEAFKAICGQDPPAIPAFRSVDAATGLVSSQPVQLMSGPPAKIPADVVYVVGCGAVGSAALLALASFPLVGVCAVDQPDNPIDATNLNRYLLATTRDVGKPKAAAAKARLTHAAWPILARDSGWVGVRQAMGKGLGVNDFERRVAAAENEESYPAVLSGVDAGAARRDIQRALPKAFVQGNTGGLNVQVRSFNLADPNAECGACRARTVQADHLANLLRGLSREQQKAKVASAGIPWSRVEAFLGPECATLTEDEKENLRPHLEGHDFSVSFVSALAGFTAAAQLLTSSGATSMMQSYNLWDQAGLRLPIRRDPTCECATMDYHRFHARKWM